MSPQKPGRLADCPGWCMVDHSAPLDPVHRGVAAQIERHPIHLVVIVESDPCEASPLVDITTWDLAADTSAAVKAAVSLLEGPKS